MLMDLYTYIKEILIFAPIYSSGINDGILDHRMKMVEKVETRTNGVVLLNAIELKLI